MSIKTKLILFISSALIVISFTTELFVNGQNNIKLRDHTSVDVKNTINYTSQLINFYLGSAEGNLNNLANDPAMIEALTTKDPIILEQISQKMTMVNDAVGAIENVSLSEVVGSSCVVITADQSAGAVVGSDFFERDYCKGILKTKTTYLSSAFISSVSNRPVLGLVVPVKNNKGEMLGFIYGSIDLAELRGYLWDLQKDSKIELLDRYGTMFLNTEEKITTLNNLSDTEEEEIDTVKEGIFNNKVEGIFQDADNFVGYKFDGDITIVFEQSAVNLLALAKSINFFSRFSLIISLIVTVSIIFIFVGKITKNITHLSKIARDFSLGRFETELDEKCFKGKDEVSVLGRIFKEMSVKLVDIYKDLENKIKQRTKEIEKKNFILEKALADEERANKLMVGRELEMIKLKKEIMGLKNKSNL